MSMGSPRSAKELTPVMIGNTLGRPLTHKASLLSDGILLAITKAAELMAGD